MKIILLCASLLLAVVSQAQAVFEIKSPPSISGYYTISLGDSTVHYWGNGSIAKKSITAELMLATGADSLASTTLKGDYTGKIAVIFRGAVSFAAKALKAQAAGAVAVVIVNHGNQQDGSVNADEVFTMAGGTSYSAGDGAFVTIPVIMISKNSYLKLSPVLRSGETVEGYIGGKQSLDYDLKLSSDLLIVPTKSTRTKSMVRQGMVSDTLGFSLINNGDKDQYNIGVRALIVKGLDTLYNRGLFIDTIVSKDTIGYYFFGDQSGALPFRPSDDLDTGRYDLTFSVVNLDEVTFKDTLIDQYDQDNVVKTSFYVTDSIYSIAKMSSYKASNGKTFHNVPVWGTATRPGSTYTNYSSCIVYKDNNVSNLEASSMTFMAYMTAGVLKDNLFKVNVFEWNDQFVDIRDSLFAFNDLNPLIDNQEYFSSDSLTWDYQTVKFDQTVKLNARQRYLFCVTTSNPNVMFGFDDDSPSLRGATLVANREPLFAIAIDGKYYAAGWSPGYKYIPTISVNVSEPSCISASILSTDEKGFESKDGTAQIIIESGSNNLTYTWDDANNSKTKKVENLAPGTYSVTISNGSCSIVKKVTIKKYQCKLVSEMNKVDETSNSGNNGKASVVVKGGTQPYNYSWSTNPVQTDSFAINLTPGKYFVTVKDKSGCYITDSVEISKYICKLTVSTTKSDESGFNLNDGNATVSPKGGSRPYTYVWNSNPTQTDSLASKLTPGKYYVTVNDAAGCSAKDSVEIKSFVCTLSITTGSTEESGVNKKDATAKVNVIGGQAPFSYTWSTNPVQTTNEAKDLTAGVVRVVVLDKNGCRDSADVKIVTKGCTISVSTKSYNETKYNSKDGAIKAIVSGANGTIDYSWSNLTATTDSVSKLAPGSYKVTVKDVNGCVAEENAKIAAYICKLSINVTGTSESSLGKKDGKAEVKILSGKSPYTYSWNTTPAKTTAIASGLSFGKYIVTVKDAAGCIKLDSIVIAPIVCNLKIDSTKIKNESATNKKDGTVELFISGQNSSYKVYNGTTQVNSNKVTGLTKGSYKFKVIDAKGCEATTDVMIGNLSISKQNVLNVALFPNPMSEQLNVSFVANNNVSLILSGISGNVIETKNVSGIVKTSFNTSSLSSGVYLITIKDNESSYSYKVVKE